MRIAKDETAPMLDVLADPNDMIDLTVYEQLGRRVLAVHVNGVCVLRIGRIQQQILASFAPDTVMVG